MAILKASWTSAKYFYLAWIRPLSMTVRDLFGLLLIYDDSWNNVQMVSDRNLIARAFR
jgi:hypothetical protein